MSTLKTMWLQSRQFGHMAMGFVPIRQFWWSVRIDPSEGTHTNWWKNSSTAAASMAKRALSRHIARHCRGIRVRDFCLSYWSICLRKCLTKTLIFSNHLSHFVIIVIAVWRITRKSTCLICGKITASRYFTAIARLASTAFPPTRTMSEQADEN